MSAKRSWDELRYLFSSRQGLPPIPEPALRLTKIVEDSDFSAQDAEQAVLADPGLTTSVLRAASSASLAMREPVTSVRQAVTLLGAKQLRSLASALMTMAVVNKGAHRSALPVARLGEAGVTVGKAFARLSPHHDASAYACGVVGQAPAGFLSLVDPASFDQAWAVAKEKSLSLEAAFMSVHGRSLFELGVLGLRAVGVPESLVVPIEGLVTDPSSPLALVRRGVDFLGYGTTTWTVAWPEAGQHMRVVDAVAEAIGLSEAA